MKDSLPNHQPGLTKRLPFFVAVAMSVLLSACSDSSDTTTILDVNPMLFFGLPDELLEETFFDPADIRPIVSLSNGDAVTMIRDGQELRWSGTINLRPGTTYQVTETWVERFENINLPLISRTYTLVVNSDGTASQPVASGFGEEFDNDGDGPSNLEERKRGSNPLRDEDDGQSAPENDSNPGDESSEPVTVGVPEPIDVEVPLPDDVEIPEPDPDSDEPGTFDEDPDPTEPNEEGEEPDQLPIAADVIVPRISDDDAPGIDGFNVTLGTNNEFTGEWAQAIQLDTNGALLTIDNLMVDIDAETVGDIPFRRWAAMHDGTYLYVVVIVDDDGQRHRDSGSTLYDDDSLELYLDADNSKSTEYGDDDFHRLFPIIEAGEGGSRTGVSSGDEPGFNSSRAELDIDFATGPGIGPDGVRRSNFEQDVYELRIELESIGISSDAPFGFELQVNDDDDGDERDAKWGWKHPARTDVDVDNTYINPSLMGTMKLE